MKPNKVYQITIQRNASRPVNVVDDNRYPNWVISIDNDTDNDGEYKSLSAVENLQASMILGDTQIISAGVVANAFAGQLPPNAGGEGGDE